MRKKYLIFLAVATMLASFTLTGCSGVSASYANTDTAEKNPKVQNDFEKIPDYDNLYYAKATKIVYWIGGNYTLNVIGEDYTTSYMSPWYAENGKPYRYNPISNELEIIE